MTEKKTGRTPPEARVRLSTDISAELMKRVKQVCFDREITIRDYVTQLIEADLKKKK